MFDWLDPYTQFVAGSLLINVLLVLSLFVVFQCGVLSLATVGFMADGAYAAALLSTKAHWPAAAAIAAGTVFCGLLALVFGRLVLRLRGIYLALGTFALGQVCVLVIANVSFTGGNEGIIGIPTSVGLTTLVLVVVVVAVALQLLHRSRIGRALRAMRLDDRVAAGVGVNTGQYRAWAFAASGTLAGLAGALEAFRTVAISPEQYSFVLLVQLLALAMIGGAFHWSGGVIAAVVIGLIQQAIGEAGPLVEGFLYGGLLLAVMLLLPDGIIDRRTLRLVRRLLRRDAAPQPAAQATDVEPLSARERTSGGQQVELENVSRRFGAVTAVDDVSFSLARGSVTGLIGPNGAGKTTLLNLLTGFFKPSSGHIRIDGKDLTGALPHVVAKAGVARTYQNLLLLDDETVTENVRIGRHLVDARRRRDRHRDGPSSAEVVARVIDELGLTEVASVPVAGLPYGLRRRVEIARALASDPQVLVLDEPTAGMTRAESDDIGEVIRQLQAAGRTVLLVEHNVRLVTAVCEEVLVLDWGRLIGRESADRVWDLDAVRVAYLGQTTTEIPEEVRINAGGA